MGQVWIHTIHTTLCLQAGSSKHYLGLFHLNSHGGGGGDGTPTISDPPNDFFSCKPPIISS